MSTFLQIMGGIFCGVITCVGVGILAAYLYYRRHPEKIEEHFMIDEEAEAK